ncbi:MAG TPA: hypothetical protein VEA99_01185, partial [Gemmatimonadaceae bacterium]|nr:hypothetical protein [Gemmatimonadaceae bacterium]
PAERPIATGLDVLGRMRAAHADSVPRALSFIQANTVYLASGQVQQRWRVIVAPPMRMRMDYLPLTSRTGYLYLGDDVIAFQNGRRTSTQSQVSPTLLLSFGVFAQEPEVSRRFLDSLGVRNDLVRRDTIAGRTAWVIGAPAGDLSSDQIWVDTARWVPLRIIDRETRGTRTTITDMRLTDYVTHGGLPVATTVLVYRDRRLALRQELRDVRVNPTLPESAFDPTRWVEGQPPL